VSQRQRWVTPWDGHLPRNGEFVIPMQSAGVCSFKGLADGQSATTIFWIHCPHVSDRGLTFWISQATLSGVSGDAEDEIGLSATTTSYRYIEPCDSKCSQLRCCGRFLWSPGVDDMVTGESRWTKGCRELELMDGTSYCCTKKKQKCVYFVKKLR